MGILLNKGAHIDEQNESCQIYECSSMLKDTSAITADQAKKLFLRIKTPKLGPKSVFHLSFLLKYV